MSKVLFLDIDGVVLPGRAYFLPNQTNDPFVTIFDPCAVSLVNEACRKQGRKIVLHSSWIRTIYAEMHAERYTSVEDHLVNQGFSRENLHEDSRCNGDISWRYDRIDEWLSRHPEVTDFFILDDESCSADYKYRKHLILTDFDDGVTSKIFRQLRDGTCPKES